MAQLRRPATFCRAEVAFGNLGSTAPRFTIDGRWSTLPEPVLPGGAVFGRPREFSNAGDGILLCVAIKLEGDGRSFAFNNRKLPAPELGKSRLGASRWNVLSAGPSHRDRSAPPLLPS